MRPVRSVVLGILFLGLATCVARADTVAPSATSSVEITFQVLGLVPVPPEWNLLFRPESGKAGSVVRQKVTSKEPLLLPLPAGSSWEVSAELPGFWVPRKTLVSGRAGETTHLEVQLWPLGTLSGHIDVQPKDLELPRTVVVRTLAVPAFLHRPPVPPGTLDCPLDPKGNWSCSLPAAMFDLVITAEGFTPHYRWAVTVPPAETLSLGTFLFQRGSSVAAWVAVEDGAIEPERCIGRLSPLAACDADLKSVVQLNQAVVERPVSRDGFLQITGLSPGNYALEVRQPGLAPARVANVRVEPQSETFLPQTLVLTRPLAIEVEIVPPLDEREEAWRARVIRHVEGDSRPDPIVFDGPADAEGRFRVPDQPPGRYRVEVLDSQGNRVHSEPERQLDSASQLTIALRRIAIEGRLRLGTQPLAGTLWFGGQYGARRVKMEADAEGRFQGVLAADGLWAVDVESKGPSFRARTRTEVHPDRAGRASVTIDLPDTRVFGRVADERGQPVPQASVAIAGAGLDQHLQTDEAGAFEVRGLAEGSVALMAADGQARQSERTVLALVEGRPVGPVELRLRPSKRLTGTVLSRLGPVAGARVVVRAYAPTVGGGTAATGPEGTFSVEIPANIAAGTAVVRASGFGTKVFPLAGEEKPLSLTLPEGAGVVAISLPRSTADLYRENLSVVLFQDGLEVPLSILRAGDGPEMAGEGAPLLRLAELAPGRYSACLARRKVELKGSALDPAAKSGLECDSGWLAAGGTLALALRAAR